MRTGSRRFHLNSNRSIYFDRFLEAVHGLGIPMGVVDGRAFHDALRRTLQDSGKEYIFEYLSDVIIFLFLKALLAHSLREQLLESSGFHRPYFWYNISRKFLS